MRKKYLRLTLAEWQQLYVMKSKGKSFQEIAKYLKRDDSALKRAFNRYKVPWHMGEVTPLERAKYCWEQARNQRSKPRKRQRLKNLFIRCYVENKLKEGWSPELISGRLSLDHPEHKISYEAIYEWIFKERKELRKYLLRAGKPRRGKPGARGLSRRQPAAPKRSIAERPESVNNRDRIGDNESDLIVSSKSDACLVVMVDRRTRRVHIRKAENRLSEKVKAVLASILLGLPANERRTLTKDNGPEHAQHKELEEMTGVTIYFCHPYAAYERGTVENINGLIRRHFPKKTDFGTVTHEQVAWVERKINSRPMVILGFLSPDEFHRQEQNKFDEHLKLAA